MPVNTGLIYQGTPQQQQQQNPIQQLAALMQIMQAQKQGQLTDMEIQQKQQAMPLQLAQLQAAADKAKRVNDFYSPQNLQQFSKPEYAAVAAPPAELGGGPGREAGPMVFDENKFLNAGAMQGVIDPLELADKRAKQAQAKAALEATKQQREDAIQARLYQIDAYTQQNNVTNDRMITLARERNELMERLAQNKIDANDRKPNPLELQEAKESAKLRAAMPQAKLRVDSISQNMDRLAAIAQELHDHPGLPNITGTLYGRLPDVSDNAINAEALRTSLTSNVFQSSLQAMREASKTGGAVGNVSNREGDKLEATLGALGRVQTTDQYKKELKRVISQIQMSKGIIQAAYDEQFSGAGQGAAPATGPTNPAAAPVFTLPQIDDAARRTGKSRDEIIRDIRAKGGRLQ